MRQRIEAFAFGALGAFAIFGLAAVFSPPESTAAPAPRSSLAGNEVAWERLSEELALLRKTLENHPPSFAAPTSEVVREDPRGRELLVALKELVEQMKKARAADPDSFVEDDAPGPEPQPFLPDQVRSYITQQPEEFSATENELFGLTEAQVRRRFGTPNEAGFNNGRIGWYYDTEDGYELDVFFVDGKVLHAYIEHPQ